MLLGSDPEVFIEKDGYIVPASVLLADDTDVLLPYDNKAYPDGAAIEFSVQPTDDIAFLVDQIGCAMQTLQQFGAVTTQPCMPLHVTDIARSRGKGRGDMTILGCQKDHRVYPWVKNGSRPDPRTYPYRSIGCHVHVGLDETLLNGFTFRQYAAMFLDAVIGTTFVLLSDDAWSQRRHTLYGLSGTIRYPEYGIEYRTPPAYAIKDPVITAAYYGSVQAVICWLTGYWQTVINNEYTKLSAHLGGIDGMHRMQEAIDAFDQTTCKEIRKEVLDNMVGVYTLDICPIEMFMNYTLDNFKIAW